MIKISITLLIILFAVPGICQRPLYISDEKGKDNYSTLLGNQNEYLIKLYYQKIGERDELINGRDYVPYYYRSKLKPLLFSDKKRTGSILLNGRRYDGLSLEYDTFLDQVIYADITKFISSGLFKIALNKDIVDNFNLYFDQDSMIFRYFKPVPGNNFNIPEGFYEVAYEGKSKFIIKHQSLAIEQAGLIEYFYSASYYIMVGDGFYRIKSSRDFIKLFEEKSAEIKKYLRISKVNIRNADKKQIAAVLKYYDSQLTSER
jgi:hypothetical protein